MIPPGGRWPADQLAGGEGQGHPQPLLAAAARAGVVLSFLLHGAVGLPSKEQILTRRRRRWCKIRGRRRAGSPPVGRPAGARQGRRMLSWTAGRWGTGLPRAGELLRPPVAGGGQGDSKMDGRPATARVALLFPGPPWVSPPSGCYAEASLARGTAPGGSRGVPGGVATRAAKWAAGGGGLVWGRRRRR